MSNKTTFSENNIPNVGDYLSVFDDSKPHGLKGSTVTVKKIIPFCDAKEEIVEAWKHDHDKQHDLYADNTDYFVMATNKQGVVIYFARTEKGGWLSIGDRYASGHFVGGYGELDVTGELHDHFVGLAKKMYPEDYFDENNLRMNELPNIPQVGESLYVFDDGKITPSRESIVKVLAVIPFNEAENEVVEQWKSDCEDNEDFYDNETDFFVKAENKEGNIIWFAREDASGWFSIGNQWIDGSGRLDVTGELHELAQMRVMTHEQRLDRLNQENHE